MCSCILITQQVGTFSHPDNITTTVSRENKRPYISHTKMGLKRPCGPIPQDMSDVANVGREEPIALVESSYTSHADLRDDV